MLTNQEVFIRNCKILLKQGNITPGQYKEALEFADNAPEGCDPIVGIKDDREIAMGYTSGGDAVNEIHILASAVFPICPRACVGTLK